MYRLVFYYLAFLLIVALVLSAFGQLPFSPMAIAFSTSFLIIACVITNVIFSHTFEALTNFESAYITAFILALIITPSDSFQALPFLGWAAVLAMSSKYILAIGKKHIFNPVAIAVFLTAYVLNLSATWWVGSSIMLPFVFLGGLLIVKKTKRLDLVISFFTVSLTTIISIGLLKHLDPLKTLQKSLFDSPLIFFAFVMLTEPLTTPPSSFFQTIYGALVGFLFAPQIHLGSIFSTPEIALISGNIFSYLVSPKQKLMLTLKQRLQIAPDIYDFIFESDKKIKFTPGQYLEWTLPEKNIDSRGNRRYFTLASSPTEPELRIGVKFYPKPSSFKRNLGALAQNEKIVASQLSGEFILPKNPNKKLVFIAGGIGITPFRSMIKYLLDTNQQRDIVLFYATKTAQELVYTDIFNESAKLGVKTIYVVSDQNTLPADWQGKVGFIDRDLLISQVGDFNKRTFFISGPRAMVLSFQKTLKELGISKNKIKTDFFPGFA